MSSTQNESPKTPMPSLLQEVINIQTLENIFSADLNVSEVELDGGMMNASSEKMKLVQCIYTFYPKQIATLDFISFIRMLDVWELHIKSPRKSDNGNTDF